MRWQRTNAWRSSYRLLVEGRMPNRIAILASLVIISTVTAITARSGGAAPAGETCLGKPDGSAPEGSYWYSRVDRATHRRCWYVRPNGMKGRHAALPKR